MIQKIKNLIDRLFSNEKNKVIIKNVIFAFLVKGGGLLLSLATMPAYIRFFNNQIVLGVWFTILSVLTWIMNFDLGIGNGLRNNLVKALETNDKKEVKHLISSAYISIGILSVIIFIAGLVVARFLDWNSIFNISKDIISAKSMLIAVSITFIGMMFQFFFKLINSILYAIQKSAINNFINFITQASILLFVLIYPSKGDYENNLIVLSIIHALCTNIPLIILSIIIFRFKLRESMPSFKFFGKNYAKKILSIGGIFLACQILYMLIMNTNEFFISKLMSPEYVVDYQIYFKLFSLTGTLFSLALTPIWSAVTKAIAQSDYLWLKKLMKFLRIFVVIATGMQFLIIPLLPFILKIWLGSDVISVNYIYASLFALFGSIFVYHNTLSTIVCGTGKMKLQFVSYLIGFIVRVIIIYFGIKLFNTWIVIVVANIIIILPYAIIQDIVLNKYIKANLKYGGSLNV